MERMFDILSFHPGKQHNFEQAHQLGLHFPCFRHVTSIYFRQATLKSIGRWLPGISRQLNVRSAFAGIDLPVDTYILPEMQMLVKRSLGRKLGYKEFMERNEHFQDWLLRNYKAPRLCIGYDTSSWKVFEQWKNRSFLMLDLSIAVPHYKRKLAKMYGLSEAFTKTQTSGDDLVYDTYEKELELADLILCGSEFVKDSCLYMGVDPSKLIVLPYGADLKKFSLNERNNHTSERIKVVFIGSVNYRKGADLLLRVWQRIVDVMSNVELHFYGNVQIDISTCPDKVFFHGFLRQEELISELKDAHISVLPTFFEGSSLVIYQSMAMGLAVITTPNAGSIIRDQHNGLLVNYGNADQLYACLLRLIQQPMLRRTLSKNALCTIKEYTWERYGNELAGIVREKMNALSTIRK